MVERYTKEVEIEKMVFGGASLTRVDGQAHFVEGALPGEKVTAVFDKKKGGVPFGYTKKVIEQSNSRRIPNCRYYGECGGCDWLHINYEEQLKFKKEIFIEQLNRVGKISSFPQIETVSDKEYGYRCRAQLKVNISKNRIGFFRKGTNDIINIDNCPLLDDRINKLLSQKEKLFSLLKKEKQIKIISTDDGLVTYPELEGISNYSGAIKMDNLKFSINGKSFFQSNKSLASEMARHLAKIATGKTFIDMYGGVGFFSLYLSKKINHGLLVETDQKMVTVAKDNFVKNSITNVDSMVLSAETFFDFKEITTPDILVVDPPRPGLTKAVRNGIAKLGPQKIVYISCNPSTQARDIGFLVNEFGYHITKLTLFDLYPNTHHMETMILIEKSKKRPLSFC